MACLIWSLVPVRLIHARKPLIYDATAENFAILVLENSRKGPVVASFGSPMAAPCHIALDRLDRLAAEHGGRFLLIHVNTDAQTGLARRRDVQSIPTTRLYIAGEQVETVPGDDNELVQTYRRKLLENY